MNLVSHIPALKPRHILWLTVIVITWLNFNQERWMHKAVIDYDVNHYYSYLPAFFLEHDLALSFLSDQKKTEIERRYYAPNHTPQGKPVIKMTMGTAIGYLPFFALAHLYANIFKYDLDGFSVPYHFAIQFSSMLYFVVGLYFLSKLLRRFADESTVTLTLFLIVFASNVFFYLSIRAGNVHTYDFFLAVLFLHYSVIWHERPTLLNAVMIGFSLGLLTLTRPINILYVIFLFLYNLRSRNELTKKIQLFRSHKVQLVVAILIFVALLIPQLLYWKTVSGHYFFDSYVGEHFFFDRPRMWKGLFSFRNGWLIYTPVMIFSIIGLMQLRGKTGVFALPVITLVILYLYVTFSWWCWWYGGSFGQRALIDIYPLLAIPLSAILLKVKHISHPRRKLFYGILAFFVALNLFQTMQAKYNIIHYDSMTPAAYLHTFGRTTGIPDRENYLQHPDYEAAREGRDEVAK